MNVKFAENIQVNQNKSFINYYYKVVGRLLEYAVPILKLYWYSEV